MTTIIKNEEIWDFEVFYKNEVAPILHKIKQTAERSSVTIEKMKEKECIQTK